MMYFYVLQQWELISTMRTFCLCFIVTRGCCIVTQQWEQIAYDFRGN
jgi:hypothetical protein